MGSARTDQTTWSRQTRCCGLTTPGRLIARPLSTQRRGRKTRRKYTLIACRAATDVAAAATGRKITGQGTANILLHILYIVLHPKSRRRPTGLYFRHIISPTKQGHAYPPLRFARLFSILHGLSAGSGKDPAISRQYRCSIGCRQPAESGNGREYRISIRGRWPELAGCQRWIAQ